MKAIGKIGKWIVQHINLIIILLLLIESILCLRSGFSGIYAQRAYERQKIENQIQIEKAQTEKELAIIEAEKEAEVLRIKGSADAGD